MSRLNPYHILILAAGASTRMGQPKQLLAYQGSTLLEHAINTALSCHPISVKVVLGAHVEAIQKNISLEKVDKVYNSDWQRGMAGSIKCGITVIMEGEDANLGTIIMLGDQPLISSQFLQKLYQEAEQQQKEIAASAYQETLGVPAYFSSFYYEKLLGLSGQGGAGKLIQVFKEEVASVPAGKFLADIDTPEEYQNLIKGGFSRHSE
ncbi:MAG: nucleotidyltransferase family protein [Bacteroidota bacterium]